MGNKKPTYDELKQQLAEAKKVIAELRCGEVDAVVSQRDAAIRRAKKLEKQLKSSEQNFRRSVDESPLGISIVGVDGEVLYANRAVLSIYGYDSIEELKQTPMKRRYTPESYADFLIKAESRKRGEPVPDSYEMGIIRKNGETRRLELFRKEAIWDGKPQLQLLFHDITERKNVEQALRESEDFSTSLLESAPNPIIVVNPDTSCKYVNPALVKLTGYSKEELLGRKAPRPYWPKDKKTEYVRSLEKSMERGVARLEQLFYKKNGEPFWVEITATNIMEGNKIKYHLTNWIDITERKRIEKSLKESEDFSTSLLEKAPNPIHVSNPDTSIRYVNPAMVKLAGYSKEELIGKKAPYPYWPEERRTNTEYLKQFEDWRGKGADKIERLFCKKSGEPFWVEISMNRVTEDGKLKYVLTNWVDITERKKIEKGLRESEQFITTLLENAPNPIHVIDADISLRYVNTALTKLSGYSKEELIGKKPPYPYWPKNRPEYIDALKESMENGTLKRELQFYKKSGEPFWIERSSVNIIEDGKLKYHLVNWVDITERKKIEHALKESEEFSTSLLESAPNPIMLVNPDTSIRYVNTALVKLTGYSKEELLGRKAPYPYWPKSKPDYVNMLNKSMETGAARLERLFYKKNGEPFWVELTAINVMDGDKLKYHLTNWIDVTERKQAEEALQQQRDQAQNYLDIAGVIIVAIDSKGEVTLVNRKGCEILGYKATEIIGKNWFDHFLPERNRGSVRIVFNQLIAGQSKLAKYYENSVLTKTGEERIIAWHNTIINDDSGDISGTLSSGEDITERKMAEKSLKESQEFSNSLLENAPNPIHVSNADTSIRYVNPAMVELTGYSKEELIGKKAPYPYWPKDNPEYLRVFEANLRKEIAQGEFLFLKKNGEPCWVEITLKSVIEDGKVKYNLTNWVDITERKKMEKEREELIVKLTEALANVKALSGLLPICANCKKIRDDKGYWGAVEGYIMEHSEAKFSHGLCPDCMKKLYPDLFTEKDTENGTIS